jgi:CPA1 family monovalent cation:H+ antiporter
MVIAIIFSTLILLLPQLHLGLSANIQASLAQVDFPEVVLHGMLSFLLFAGSLHVDLHYLKKYKSTISFLAFIGTIFSTIVAAFIIFYVSMYFGQPIHFVYALLFGALISPTDPIAVMALLKKAGISKSIESKVVGESLFNDGVAVVLFVTLLELLSHGNINLAKAGLLFIKEACGGIFLGAILGYMTYNMLKKVDNYQVEIMLTLALVMGGYELAYALHLSAPITMVIAGLIIGNHGRENAMSQHTRHNLDNFWELMDEFLNAILFLLIGLELMLVKFNPVALYVGLVMIPILLILRFFSVSLPILLMRYKRDFSRGTITILTWGGLRGGISVALVLSLPTGETRDFLLLVTYCVVLFSILVQGLTVAKVAAKFSAKPH